MTSDKVLRVVGVVLGVGLALYFVRSSVGNFANVNFLGGLLFLEILIACVWKYEQRFFPLVIIAFLWAGVGIPLHAAWTTARWVVLATGAAVGFIVWTKKGNVQFSTFHLIALFCAAAAFVSATVSPIPQMAALKALSLFLLFLYGSGGARAGSHRPRPPHSRRGHLPGHVGSGSGGPRPEHGQRHGRARELRRRDRRDGVGPKRARPRHGTGVPRRVLGFPPARRGRALNPISPGNPSRPPCRARRRSRSTSRTRSCRPRPAPSRSSRSGRGSRAPGAKGPGRGPAPSEASPS